MNKNESIIPVGPLHVALEEPMYFKTYVEGETIKRVDITAGFVHRGLESLSLSRNFYQNITLTERVCSLCSNNHPFTYCMALEKIANLDVPRRAEFLRVIADEIKRMASNLFNSSMVCHIIGFDSFFMHIMEIREVIQDVKEAIYGNRMNLSANTIGGVKYNITKEQTAYIAKRIESIRKPVDEILKVFQNEKMIKNRTIGVGVLPKEEAIRYGVVGPVARASGINNDVRVKAPYAAYDEIEVNIPLETSGDVHARSIIRLREVQEAANIILYCLKNMPDTPIGIDYLPTIPAGEAIARSEAPRGELIYYLKTNRSDIPDRMKWRVPTYMNWEPLNVMMPGNSIADIALIVSSIDPCVSCTER